MCLMVSFVGRGHDPADTLTELTCFIFCKSQSFCADCSSEILQPGRRGAAERSESSNRMIQSFIDSMTLPYKHRSDEQYTNYQQTLPVETGVPDGPSRPRAQRSGQGDFRYLVGGLMSPPYEIDAFTNRAVPNGVTIIAQLPVASLSADIACPLSPT